MAPVDKLSLDDEYVITPAMREQFQRDGFIKLKEVVTAEQLAFIEPFISAAVADVQKRLPQPREGDFYSKQFVQVSATWKHSETIRAFTFSKRFARMAGQLMGVRSVRLYHDQALYKLPGGSRTYLHQDMPYWPLDTSNTCTLWMPLQAVTQEMGPLGFYRGSHRAPYKSTHTITPEGEHELMTFMDAHGCELECTPFALGEVSFHLGWTCHTANPNVSTEVRRVHTINYFEGGTRVAEPTPNQIADWKLFLRKAPIGQVIDSKYNPLLWQEAP